MGWDGAFLAGLAFGMAFWVLAFGWAGLGVFRRAGRSGHGVWAAVMAGFGLFLLRIGAVCLLVLRSLAFLGVLNQRIRKPEICASLLNGLSGMFPMDMSMV